MLLAFSILSEHFFSISNILNILTSSSIVGLLAIGLTFVIATGGIDLSVGSILALSSVTTAMFISTTSSNIFLAFFIAILTGAISGLINGFLINLTSAPSFIVTLGTLSIYRSISFILTDATPIYGLPETLIDFYQSDFLGIPISLFIFFVSAMISYFLLGLSKTGRHLQLFGDNLSSAKALGISENLITFKAFLLSGIFSGIAGFLFMVKTNSGDPASAINYELLAITAVILGGASLFGGAVSLVGTISGVFLIGILQNGLNLYGVSTYYQILFVGSVLIISGSKNVKLRSWLR
jgi:ribose transport system permease protein